MRYLVLFLFSPFIIIAQEHNVLREKSAHHDEEHGKIRIAATFSQTYIPEYYYHDSEDFPSQLIPTDGVEIQYFLTEKLSVKWTNEIELMSYILKDEGTLSKVRKNAYLTTLIMGYEISKFGLFAGVGYEFEKDENLLVTRFGIEYIGKVNDHIDISPAYIFDTMGGSHVSHSFALAIGYHF